mmetsp:Transcript_35884/g.58000  ORF Transcript_35884/g.58000 Transcript_35884/m.58000 type:complete len:216 (-) Transcript_35884:218-865(-)
MPLRYKLQTLYQHDKCRSCMLETETRTHLFYCPSRWQSRVALQQTLDDLFTETAPNLAAITPLSCRLRCFDFSTQNLLPYSSPSNPPNPHTPNTGIQNVHPLAILCGALPAALPNLFQTWRIPIKSVNTLINRMWETVANYTSNTVWKQRNHDVRRCKPSPNVVDVGAKQVQNLGNNLATQQAPAKRLVIEWYGRQHDFNTINMCCFISLDCCLT